MIMKIITELHGGLGHESSGREGEGHTGFDKWTVKVPIWPGCTASLPPLLSPILPLLPLFHSPPSVLWWAGVKAIGWGVGGRAVSQ